jgi:hypothetical protein
MNESHNFPETLNDFILELCDLNYVAYDLNVKS